MGRSALTAPSSNRAIALITELRTVTQGVNFVFKNMENNWQTKTQVALLLAVGLGIRWLTISRRYQNSSRRRLPKRLVLIRHGQSEGNATPKKAVYRSTPDHLIALTERGKAEARHAGKLLKVLLSRHRPDGRAKFFCSPHVRARQTLEGVCCSMIVDGNNYSASSDFT